MTRHFIDAMAALVPLLCVACSSTTAPGGTPVIDVAGDPVSITTARCLLDIGVNPRHSVDVRLDNLDTRDPTTLYSPGSTASLSLAADAPASGGALDGPVFDLYLIYDAAPTEREDQSVIKWYWPTQRAPAPGVELHIDHLPARTSARRDETFTSNLRLTITEAQVFHPAGQVALGAITLGPQTVSIACQGQVIESAD